MPLVRVGDTPHSWSVSLGHCASARMVHTAKQVQFSPRRALEVFGEAPDLEMKIAREHVRWGTPAWPRLSS